MRSIASLFSAAALFTSAVVSAHNIQLNAHGRECFHETLHKDDRMSVTFQVGDREFGGAGNLDVDFWVGFRFFRCEREEGRFGGRAIDANINQSASPLIPAFLCPCPCPCPCPSHGGDGGEYKLMGDTTDTRSCRLPQGL